MVSAAGGVNPALQFGRSVEDLARILQDSQAQVMAMADKLLKAGVQQAVQDSSVGARIDITA